MVPFALHLLMLLFHKSHVAQAKALTVYGLAHHFSKLVKTLLLDDHGLLRSRHRVGHD